MADMLQQTETTTETATLHDELITSPTSNRAPRGWSRWVLPLLLVLGFGALSLQQWWLHEQTINQQRQTTLQVAHLQQQQELLTTYKTSITELMLQNKLQKAEPQSVEYLVVQVKTTDTLRRLDADGKGQLLLFLGESKLILDKDPVIVLRDMDAHGANLRKLDLRESSLLGLDLHNVDARNANLSFTVLSYTNLSNANLAGADLHGADLKSADLRGADLSGANLKDVINLTAEQLATVKSLQGAIMPDSSIHK
jgi:uncharacterized protein YjbI with pentapeptide repeats